MESILDAIQTGHLVILGVIATLFALTLLFKKQVDRKWEYEAEFHDKWGNELGELDIQMLRIGGDAAEFLPHATLVFKHAKLTAEDVIQVYIEDELVLEGRVTRDGRVRLTDGDLMSDLRSASAGQECTVRRRGEQLAAAALVLD